MGRVRERVGGVLAWLFLDSFEFSLFTYTSRFGLFLVPVVVFWIVWELFIRPGDIDSAFARFGVVVVFVWIVDVVVASVREAWAGRDRGDEADV